MINIFRYFVLLLLGSYLKCTKHIQGHITDTINNNRIRNSIWQPKMTTPGKYHSASNDLWNVSIFSETCSKKRKYCYADGIKRLQQLLRARWRPNSDSRSDDLFIEFDFGANDLTVAQRENADAGRGRENVNLSLEHFESTYE